MKKMLTIAVVAVMAAVSAFAGTQDKTGGGSTSGYPPFGNGAVLFERVIDFSLSAHTGTANEVYQMLDIPAGTFVIGVGYEVVAGSTDYTGEDSTCTIDIGDGSDTDGWIDGANVETGQTATAYCYWPAAHSFTLTNVVGTTTNTYITVGAESGVNGAYATGGKLYQSTDTIDMKLNNAAGTLKIWLRAVGIPVGGLD